MQKNKKFLVSLVISAAFMVGMAVIFNACKSDDDPKPVAPAAVKKYQGSIWIAGHGGHLTKAKIKIDPSNTTDPITLDSSPTNIQIQGYSVTGNDLHDVRLDGTVAGGTLYWSTYTLDASSKLHYGSVKVDGTSLVDKTTDPAVRGGKSSGTAGNPFYCASAQTGTYFMPISMSHEGYISLIKKADLDVAPVNVYLHNYVGDLKYVFMHGNTNPKGDKLFISVNADSTIDAGATLTSTTAHINSMPAAGTNSRKSKFWIFNTSDVTAVAASGDLPAGKTNVSGSYKGGDHVTFRSTWTRDGKKVLVAGGDRVMVLDATAANLDTPLFVTTTADGMAGENHDAMPTEDGKFALLTLRVKTTSTETDGNIQLYDLTTGETVGSSVNVCTSSCHTTKGRILCGLDGRIWADGSAEPPLAASY